jgi:hypothetical protein
VVNQSSILISIGDNILEYLGRTFPIACASDEFIYFPQVQPPEPEWNIWDHFSSDTVEETAQRLSSWEGELELLSSKEMNLELHIDIALLKKTIQSLREQLSEVRSWEFQPTFYLTMACIGLTQAMESKDEAAIHDRVRGLPGFLDQARHNLNNVPVLFRDIGLEMVADTGDYLAELLASFPEMRSALAALGRFEDNLHRVSTREDFLLQRDLLEQITRFHLQCGMSVEDVGCVLDQEIEETQEILMKEARELFSGQTSILHSEQIWLEVLRNIPLPRVDEQGLVRLYKEELSRLAKHCIDQSLVLPRLVSSCPVDVLPIPGFLSAIRVGASYSIPPRHPPAGGRLYIPIERAMDESGQASHREYRMTCAHETYPGHHLLDSSRWSLEQPLRRNIEQPIFYEGWACFAEELMRLTGYFSESADQLLLARRRLTRAVRGKVDIGLQTGAMDLATAAKYLEQTGIGGGRARLLARKYPLNPGYQLCYTIGLRRFLDLWHRYGDNDLPKFVQTVLNQGEILFHDLEKVLQDCQ